MKLKRLEQLRVEITAALDELTSLADQAETPEEIVSVAWLLWDLGERAKQGVGPLKDKLRIIGAEAAKHRPGAVRLASLSGKPHAQITIPKPQLALRKDVNISQLRAFLGTEDFERLFTSKTTYKPNQKALKQELKTAGPERKAILLNSLDQVSSTVRVGFPKQ